MYSSNGLCFFFFQAINYCLRKILIDLKIKYPKACKLRSFTERLKMSLKRYDAMKT